MSGVAVAVSYWLCDGRLQVTKVLVHLRIEWRVALPHQISFEESVIFSR